MTELLDGSNNRLDRDRQTRRFAPCLSTHQPSRYLS